MQSIDNIADAPSERQSDIIGQAGSIFRKCDITGFLVDKKSESLIRINAVLAVVSLLIGIIGALLLLLTRWQEVHLLSQPWYYRMLNLHGMNALVFWLVFFEVAGLYFGSTVVLNARMVAPKLGWVAFILMLVGFAMVNWKILAGDADVMFTSYVPLKAHPLYYLGIILFAVGALIGCGIFFANLYVAKKEKKYGTSLPLFTYGLVAAGAIAVMTLLSGAMAYVPTFFWSLGLIENIDVSWYRVVWWGFGHSSQQINVTAMISIWYLTVTLSVGGTSINEKVSRFAFMLYILFISIASAHHLLVDPVVESDWKVWNTSYAMHLAVLASMIHAFAVPSAIESAQRRKGYVKSMFDWLKNAPWSNPAFSAVAIAIIGFGFLGGISGVVFGMEQTNIIVHNTIAITGHFKGTVVIGTTLTFMGITYYLIPLIFRRKIVGFGLAKYQPWMFGIGIALVSVGMMAIGMLGVPRRVYDATFAGGPFTHDFNPIIGLLWTITAVGGILAFVGALVWILIVVVSVFFGPKVESASDMQVPISPMAPDVHLKSKYEAPGTLVLALIFMLAFLVFFYLNWKWLAAIWEIK
ncbi:MAG: cbb3-type cytochrome c oxidase subunit I [Cytophagaceae bacterium]